MCYERGHNKHLYVLGYLLWRAMTYRQQTIEYLMQIPGIKLPSSNYLCMRITKAVMYIILTFNCVIQTLKLYCEQI